MTIFFAGVMLWTKGAMPAALLVVPIGWAIVGTSAAVQLGIREDFALPVAAGLLLAELGRRRWSRPGKRLATV